MNINLEEFISDLKFTNNEIISTKLMEYEIGFLLSKNEKTLKVKFNSIENTISFMYEGENCWITWLDNVFIPINSRRFIEKVLLNLEKD